MLLPLPIFFCIDYFMLYDAIGVVVGVGKCNVEKNIPLKQKKEQIDLVPVNSLYKQVIK